MIPLLWLAAEDEIAEGEGQTKYAHFPVMTCKTCGQHYFISFLKDFDFIGGVPGGGEASDEGLYWEPLTEKNGGKRVVLTDRIVGREDEDAEESERIAKIHFCRYCGAGHQEPINRCLNCSHNSPSFELLGIRQKAENPGKLSSCVSCTAKSSRSIKGYREPSRPVRATQVSDIHVLAQDMVHHLERPRLLVFCDNRQDAAFQAGWMKDHARRFRLRALISEGMKNKPVSIGDLTHYLDELLDKDDSLSRSLLPEVWKVQRSEGSGGRHEQERRKFLRIQVLREVTTSPRQSIGLEPWGRMKVNMKVWNLLYHGFKRRLID